MFSPQQRAAMLRIAARSVRHGLEGGGPSIPAIEGLSGALLQPRGAFVTLRVRGDLNGCIGSIEPDEPLALVIARVAWEAAFDDPRLPVLREDQLSETHLEISVLSPPEPIAAGSREELLRTLRPGIDGLIIEAGPARATFLPAVWASIPAPEDFVARLLHKAGLRADVWPRDAKAFRYGAVEFGADFLDAEAGVVEG